MQPLFINGLSPRLMVYHIKKNKRFIHYEVLIWPFAYMKKNNMRKHLCRIPNLISTKYNRTCFQIRSYYCYVDVELDVRTDAVMDVEPDGK